MNNQENKNDNRSVDHKFWEEGRLGIIDFHVSNRPGKPILNLYKKSIKDMQNKATE